MKQYPELKFAFCPAIEVIKAVDGQDSWKIRGYAATSDLDRQNDVIAPEALARAVADLKRNTTVFYEHKHDQPPVGKILNAGTDEQGLWVEVMVSKTRPDIWQLIQEGILSKFSIGGKLKQATRGFSKEKNKEFNHIQDLEILEVSIVGLPANENAEFAVSQKSLIGGICKALEGASPIDTEEGRDQIVIEANVEIQKDAAVLEAAPVETPAAVETKAVEPAAEVKVEETKVEEPKAEVKPVEEPKAEEVAEEVIEKTEKAVQVVPETLPKPTPIVGDASPAPAKGPTVEEEIKGIKETLARIEALLQEWSSEDVADEAPTPLETSCATDPHKVMAKSLTIEEVTEVINKSLDSKLGKIRLVPSRKGTIIKTDIDLKEDDGSEESLLLDENKFNALPKAKQNEIIRKGFATLFKS